MEGGDKMLFRSKLLLQKQQAENEERALKTNQVLSIVAAPVEQDYSWSKIWQDVMVDPLTQSLYRISNPEKFASLGDDIKVLKNKPVSRYPVSTVSGMKPADYAEKEITLRKLRDPNALETTSGMYKMYRKLRFN